MCTVPSSGQFIDGGTTLEMRVDADQRIGPEPVARIERLDLVSDLRERTLERLAPLARISRDNVKNLKLAYAVPLGGGAGNEFTNATPLAEDGFLYVTDSWNVLYKIDARSGDFGRIAWRMDPKQDRQMRSRGAALWGNLVITGAGGFGNSPARHRDRQGNRQSGLGKLVLGHAGRDLLFDGTVAAFDATTPDELWEGQCRHRL
jgi:alcohol dehydrogenase (cytochrome c)